MTDLPKIMLSKALSNLMLLGGKIKWACERNCATLPDSKIIYFYPGDRVNVYGYLTTIWKYNVYGEIEKNGLVVDAGASIGVYSLKVADIASRVIAVEPVPRIFTMLEKNIAANMVTNVIPVNLALSNYDGSIELHLTSQLFGEGHEISPLHVPKSKIVVPCAKLDTLMKNLKVDEITNLKIDIEGHELYLLDGSKSLLSRGSIKNMSIAVYHFKDEEMQVRKFLEIYGYSTTSKFFFDGDIILYARLRR
jgi:FkbM family methyltransferase